MLDPKTAEAYYDSLCKEVAAAERDVKKYTRIFRALLILSLISLAGAIFGMPWAIFTVLAIVTLIAGAAKVLSEVGLAMAQMELHRADAEY